MGFPILSIICHPSGAEGPLHLRHFQLCRVPHPNVVLFDVKVGFHSRLKPGTIPGGLGSSVTVAECLAPLLSTVQQAQLF